MLDRPGRIEYALPTNEDGQSPPLTLKRILVDPQRSSHVLQRSNGEIVVGGGERSLEFGGTSKTLNEGGTSSSSSTAMPETNEPSLLGLAHALAPKLLHGAAFKETHQAVRPMPQDGLPIVGFARPGLYTVVSHSGITLGPLLADLVSAEMTENVDCELLELYRLERFDIDKEFQQG